MGTNTAQASDVEAGMVLYTGARHTPVAAALPPKRCQ